MRYKESSTSDGNIVFELINPTSDWREWIKTAEHEDFDYSAKFIGFSCESIRSNPKFYDTLNAYADTLRGNYERECFFFNAPLSEWEEAMRTNMGGGLPAIGFWELKQDLYDITKV